MNTYVVVAWHEPEFGMTVFGPYDKAAANDIADALLTRCDEAGDEYTIDVEVIENPEAPDATQAVLALFPSEEDQ